MAGGNWQTQNKVRPGAYINVIGVPKPLSSVGERGTVAIPMELAWGDTLIALNANELVSGASQEKAGVLFSDTTHEAICVRLILQNAANAIIYRMNSNGVKAAGALTEDGSEVGIADVTAKYAGSFGNRLSVKIEKKGATEYIFSTYIDGALKESTKHSNLSDIQGNAWVDVSIPTGAALTGSSVACNLTGGSNGTPTATALSDALSAFEGFTWNVLAASVVTSTTDKQLVEAYIDQLRNDYGTKVQAVISDFECDNEAIISPCQRYRVSDGSIITKAQQVCAVAGMTAGAPITESLSGAIVKDAIEILDTPKTNSEIIDALNKGKFVFTRRADGAIIVEQDINTLHTLTPTKGYAFKKNRPLRVLDQIANDIKALFIGSYLGKVSNNENGRNIFKADLIAYFKQLETLGAVQNFDSETDITISAGNDIDAVCVECFVQPVDSMEKLYMKVNVEG